MRADDDGFVSNPKKIIRTIGANEDDLKILFTKQFVIPFENGIVVIRHWKLNNYLRKDRYVETIYKEEKKMLIEDENGVYNLNTTPNTVTYFASDSVVEGTVKTEGDVEIAGPFRGDVVAKGKVILRSKMEGNITAASLHLMGCTLVGNVNSEGSVLVDEAAAVTGNMTAGELISSGTIKGDLTIKGNLTLNAHATVEGNIVTGTMTMMQGALITGDVKMGAK